MKGDRLEAVFLLLKGIRRTVDDAHVLAERAIQESGADRALAEHLRDAVTGGEWGKRFPEPPIVPTSLPVLAAMVEMILGGGAGLHTLCLRLIDERETLAKELEGIRGALDYAGIVPRSDNLGKGARDRGTDRQGGD